MTVTIGIDPHKRSHTASGYDYAEQFERGLDVILDGIERTLQ